jgi:hypothetical protein
MFNLVPGLVSSERKATKQMRSPRLSALTPAVAEASIASADDQPSRCFFGASRIADAFIPASQADHLHIRLRQNRARVPNLRSRCNSGATIKQAAKKG